MKSKNMQVWMWAFVSLRANDVLLFGLHENPTEIKIIALLKSDMET